MTLLRFKIENHPQQVGRRGADDKVDERITPDWLFQHYHDLHRFTLDAAANADNTKVLAYYSREIDGLEHSWAPHRVWCNPPFSNLGAWLAKAHAEFAAGCPVIVMLLPANRSEQRWWQEHVEPFRDQPAGFLKVEFLAKRFNFGLPGNLEGKFHSSPPFGCCMLTFQSRATTERPDLARDALEEEAAAWKADAGRTHLLLQASQARVAEVEAERDEALSRGEMNRVDRVNGDNARYELLLKLRASHTRIAELEAALKPFADRWRATFGGEHPDDVSDNDLFDNLDPSDFRRAHALIHPTRKST